MKKRNKYGWMNCIRNYRFHSIFLKNLTLIFCVLLLPFIGILGVVFYSYNQVQVSEEKAYADEMITRITMNIDNLILGVRDKAMQMSFSQDVELFFRSKSVTDDMFYDPQNIIYFASLYNVSTDIIESVYVYAPNIRAVISEAGRFGYDNFYDTVCIDRWEDNGEKYQMKYLHREVVGGTEPVKTLSFYLTTQYTTEIKGVVIINIDMKKLAKELDFGDDVELMIINKEQILFDSSEVSSGTLIEDVESLMQKSDKEIVVRNQLNFNDLETIIRIDSRQLYEKLDMIRNVIFALVGVMLLVTVLLVFYISQKVFDPISEVLDALDENYDGNDDKILKNKNEMSYIKESIYANLSRTKDVEKELLERIKLLKKAQAVALQSQINPHFLSNTLVTINWMVIGRLGRGSEISEMLTCLSQLLRTTLEDSDTFVTLKEEIEYVKQYLYIQQIRLNHRFDVIWEIPQELEVCRVIKMILQPLVENAIEYGIKPYDNRGVLKLQAVEVSDPEGTEKQLCIRVVDSGLGLTAKAVEEINQSIHEKVIKESDHIGLSNVNQRVILAFGEEYGLTVKSRIHEGTCVELKLPYQY